MDAYGILCQPTIFMSNNEVKGARPTTAPGEASENVYETSANTKATS